MIVSKLVLIALAAALIFQASKSSDSIIKDSIDMVKTVMTMYEVRNIHSLLINDYVKGRGVPKTDGEIKDWFIKNFESSENERDPSLDLFGTSYIIRGTDSGFEIRSAGPDKKKMTKDDILKSYDRR